MLNDVVINTTSVCRSWQVMNVFLYPRGLQLRRGGGGSLSAPVAVRGESRQCLVRTAPRGTAGRATSQPTARGIRVVASVPGRGTVWQETPQWSDLETRVHAAFGAPIECALPHWPAGDYEAAVTAVQQWGRTAAALCWLREVLQRERVQYHAGKLRADAAVGGARGNSRLHLHPRCHLQRSGHALRASGHHHRSALTTLATLACGDRISRSARRLAESKPVAGKIDGRSTCFDARPSSPELRLACALARTRAAKA